MKGKIRIKIMGQLDKNWEDRFQGMRINYADGVTILTGNLKDEAQLHGVLNTIRDLNLKLVSLNPLSSNDNK